jgi:hypothetical protein
MTTSRKILIAALVVIGLPLLALAAIPLFLHYTSIIPWAVRREEKRIPIPAAPVHDRSDPA